MENKRKHLEMIQGIVNRHCQSSFLIKGWSVILVSGLFALTASNSQPAFIYLAYFPGIAFWILDGYYLWQEKLYRELYNHVRNLKEDEIDFSMDTTLIKDNVMPWRDVVPSHSLLLFHGTIISSILIVMIILLITQPGG